MNLVVSVELRNDNLRFIISMPKILRAICLILIFSVLTNCGSAKKNEIEAIASLLNHGKFQEAIPDLEKLLSKYPHDSRLHYLLGFSYLRLYNHSLALASLDEALKIRRNYRVVIGDVDVANFLAGNSSDIINPRFKLAVRELGKIIKENKDTNLAKEIGLHLAFLYLGKEEYLRAINQFQKVISWEPAGVMEAEVYLEIGKIYLDKLENYAKGEEVLQMVAEKYAATNEAAEALLRISGSYKKRMEVYFKRSQALNQFVKDWQGKSQLAKDVREASDQAGRDLLLAGEFQRKAITMLDLILAKYQDNPLAELAYRLKQELDHSLSTTTSQGAN